MPSSICLVECGSLKHFLEEELEEVAVVLAPVVAVVLRPPLLRVERLVERVRLTLGMAGRKRERGADEHRPSRRARGARRRGSSPTARRTTDATMLARSVAVASITASVSSGELVGVIGRGAGRAIRAAVAAPVEGDHPAVACQVRDLGLPEARMDDRPGRQQQHRRLALAVDLVEHPHTVTLDVALARRGSGRGSAPADARSASTSSRGDPVPAWIAI